MNPEPNDIFAGLKRDAKYALNSHSRDLVYKTYGAASMARSLGSITHDQYMSLNDMLVTNGLNNPRCRLK